MTIRVTVWNEFRHEKDNSHAASEIYPDGIHTPIAEYLRGKGLDVKTATLDEPEHGLTEDVLAKHRCHDLVGPHGPRRGQGRHRQAASNSGYWTAWA